jgi:DNA gyrase subunit A
MDVKGDNEVIAMDIARDDQYLLVVTENGFGKRSLVGDYRKTSRGAKGVKTISLTDAKGGLAAALVVRDHHQLLFISQNGMVQRIAVRELRPLGRNAQGFRLMNVREDDVVSAVALVMESETPEVVPEDAADLPLGDLEPGIAGEDDDGVIAADPDADELLDVPEVESDDMPDSDIEE